MILPNSANLILCLDDNSFGIYNFPSIWFEVTLGDNAPPDIPVIVSKTRKVDIIDEAYLEVYGKIEQTGRDVRLVSQDTSIKNVYVWVKQSPSLVQQFLINSLPSFWLNRYFISGEYRSINNPKERFRFNWKKLLKNRQPLRESLIHHSVSLAQKFWATSYHRQNLFNIIESLDSNLIEAEYYLINATAEYTALINCIYSILEELTHTFSVLEKISRGKDRNPSFHKLYEARAKEEEPLKLILEEAASWYELFRQRRANATHAFSPIITFNPQLTDLELFQHPEHRIYNATTSPPASANHRKDLEILLDGFDRLVEKLSIFLLSLFHPWDIVTITHIQPDNPETIETTDVWVRNIVFDESMRSPNDALVLMTPDNQVLCKSNLKGKLSLPSGK